MATRKRGKAGNKKISKLAAGLGIHFHPGAPSPRVEADSEEAQKKARRGEAEVTSTVANRAVRRVRRGKRARFDFDEAAKSTTVAPPAKKSTAAPAAKTGKKSQEGSGKHESTWLPLKNASTSQSKKVQPTQQKKTPPPRKTVPQMNARPPPPPPPVEEQSSKPPSPSAATSAKTLQKKNGAEAEAGKHRASGREDTANSLQQLEANENVTDRLAKLRLQPETTMKKEVARTPVEGAPPIPCVSRKPQLTPRTPSSPLVSTSMHTLTTSRAATSKLARANKSESALMATTKTRATPKPVAVEEGGITPVSPAPDTGRRASVGYVAMNIQKMEKGFTVAKAELDWTDMFKGSVSAAQKAIEAQKVTITREGIYIRSQRLTKKEGEPVFFHLRVAKPKCRSPEATPIAPVTPASPRDMAAPNASATTSEPTSKPARRFPMAITRMDEGFEIPDELKQYDVTEQFGGSVGKAKNAVECGDIDCSKHGVFVLSKRLTNSSGHKVYFKLTRTTHDSN